MRVINVDVWAYQEVLKIESLKNQVTSLRHWQKTPQKVHHFMTYFHTNLIQAFQVRFINEFVMQLADDSSVLEIESQKQWKEILRATRRELLGHVHEVPSSARICLRLSKRLRRFIQSIQCFSNFIIITNSIDGKFNVIHDNFFQLHTSSIEIQKNSSSKTSKEKMQNIEISTVCLRKLFLLPLVHPLTRVNIMRMSSHPK